MEYKIERGVPIPRARETNSYPWVPELSVGESVFIPNAPDSYTNGAYGFAKRRGIALTVRRDETLDGVKGYRFWRIK